MTTAAASPPGSGHEAPWSLIRVERDRIPEAASRLIEASTGGGHDATRQFLAAAAQHQIDLRNMWASIDTAGGGVRQVCLGVPGAGRTLMMFTSQPEDHEQRVELGAVIDATCAGTPGPVLAQALLDHREASMLEAYEAGGFQRLTRLAYLRRPVPQPAEFGTPAWPEDISVQPWQAGDDEEVVATLPRTYEGTLDCPELCPLRDPRDVLASHRATGDWTPDLWWVVRSHGVGQGVMLFNPSPEQGSIELTYFGISPVLRGRGIGQRLLQHGLAQLSERRERSVACAVDERNTPARRLYERLGFRAFDERIALIRPLR